MAKKAVRKQASEPVRRKTVAKRSAASQGRASPSRPGRAASRSPVKRNPQSLSDKRKSAKRTSKSLTLRGKATRSAQRQPRDGRDDFIIPLKVEKETAYPMRNLDGDVMVGVLHEPCDKSGTLIIAIHGWKGTKDVTGVKQACIELARAGYAAYRVDLSGNGDSEGRFEDATPSKELRDISATVEHFRRRYRRIILLGYSLGGTLSVIAASRCNVQGVIAVAAPMHPGRITDRFTQQQMKELLSVGFTVLTRQHGDTEIPYTITERFIEEIKGLTPVMDAHNVHCPVLLIHGTADRLVPLSDTEELAGALFHKELLLIGGADHNFTNPEHLDGLISGIIQWLRKLK